MNVSHTVIFLATAFVLGRHLWRGLKKGRILVGIGSAGETWMVRSEDPVSYWIVMLLLSVAIALLCWGAVAPWGSAPETIFGELHHAKST
jgi:hypothetical protein